MVGAVLIQSTVKDDTLMLSPKKKSGLSGRSRSPKVMLGQSKIVFAIAHTTSSHVSCQFSESNLSDVAQPVKLRPIRTYKRSDAFLNAGPRIKTLAIVQHSEVGGGDLPRMPLTGRTVGRLHYGTQHRTQVRFAICCRVKRLRSGRSDPPLSARKNQKGPPPGGAFGFGWGGGLGGEKPRRGSTVLQEQNRTAAGWSRGATRIGIGIGCRDAPDNPPLSAR